MHDLLVVYFFVTHNKTQHDTTQKETTSDKCQQKFVWLNHNNK